MKVVVYTRISDDRTGAGLGVKRQEDDCREAAAKRGWTVVEVVADNDLSAYRRRRRPGYERVIEGIKAGEWSGVLVWHLDRLYRHPLELEELIELVEATGVTIATVTGGDYDLTTTDGRAMARVVVAFARKESEDKSRRTSRKHLELAQAGAPVGGTRPFGYEPDKVTIRPVEAACIREAARRVAAGETVRSLCMEWNAAGLVGPRGGRWTQTAIRRILLSPRIAGWRSLGGEVVAEGSWEPIVDRDTWARTRAVLLSRSSTGGYGPRRYLLTGLLFCGKCGSRLIARKGRNRARTYVCTSNPDSGGCGGIRVVAEPLEEYLAGRVVKRLASREYAEASRRTPDDSRALLADVARDEAGLEQLARDHYVDRVIGRGEYLAARQALEARLSAARRRLVRSAQRERVVALSGSVEDVQAGWEQMGFLARRATVEAVIERVTVQPARRGLGRFDEARVADQIVWRDLEPAVLKVGDR